MREEGISMKELRCADVSEATRSCAFLAEGRDESEVLRKAAEHTNTVHRLSALPAEARLAIRDNSDALKDAAGKPFRLDKSRLA
jgi:predicted small metal-binding protein